MEEEFNNKRNFNYGRKAEYAGKKAIRKYLHKQPSTAATHIIRWKAFCKILNELLNIRDVRLIDNDILIECARHLRKKVETGECSVSYAQNVLSTANVVLRLIRLDNDVYISPSEYIGQRCRIRKTEPKGMDKSIIYAIGKHLRQQGKLRLAVIFIIIREFGLRKREACLFDARVALRQATSLRKIRIYRGTKGGYGRKMKRWVRVNPHQITILEEAVAIQGKNESMVPNGIKLKRFIPSIDRCWSGLRKSFDIGTIHDLRSCYACERYFQISGYPAPVCGGGKNNNDRSLERKIRRIISRELGHKRIDIISAYIGGLR